jgi:hypothetical protein
MSDLPFYAIRKNTFLLFTAMHMGELILLYNSYWISSRVFTFYYFLRAALVLALICIPIWLNHFSSPSLWFLSPRLRQLILKPVEENEYVVVSVDMRTSNSCYKVGRCFDVILQLNSDRKTLPEVVYVIVVKLPRYADKRSAKELVAMIYKKFIATRIHESRMFNIDICSLEQFLWNLALRRTKDGTWIDTVTNNEPFVDREVVPLPAPKINTNKLVASHSITNNGTRSPYEGYKQYAPSNDDGSLSEDKSM